MSRILSVLLGTLVLSGCVVTTYEGTSEAPRGPAQPIWPPLGKPAPSEDPTSGSSGHRANGNVEAISASHILVMYKGSRRAPPSITRSKDEARARAEEALARAKAGEDFAALAGEYSDEPGAAARGGSLGRFPRGVMDPAFEKAAFALAPGEVSEIVESPFGFHIIKRTE
ncbi:MAG: peptidyl-prolyl cis-trans isomerase [Polyangiaceae bacterium]|nr:peptidyl-prolyl cis-trans isomerase [Polyangiaceae bacterium]